MPRACLKIDITIIILVKAVIPKTSEGRIVKAVINAKIFSETEYVFVPFSDSVIVNASNPSGAIWENPKNGKRIIIKNKKLIFFIS